MIDEKIDEDVATIKKGFEKDGLREKCVLITGGAGFINIEYLQREGAI